MPKLVWCRFGKHAEKAYATFTQKNAAIADLEKDNWCCCEGDVACVLGDFEAAKQRGDLPKEATIEVKYHPGDFLDQVLENGKRLRAGIKNGFRTWEPVTMPSGRPRG